MKKLIAILFLMFILASARTFGFFEDAERLWAMGLAKGASPANTIVIEKDGGIMNPEGLRYEDELVRHKVLDAVGDLALAHGYIDGSYEAYNAGHKLNNLLLRALYKDVTAYTLRDCATQLLRASGKSAVC